MLCLTKNQARTNESIMHKAYCHADKVQSKLNFSKFIRTLNYVRKTKFTFMAGFKFFYGNETDCDEVQRSLVLAASVSK